MRPLPDLVEREETERAVLAPAHPGRLQPPLQLAELASPGVDQEAHLDAPLRRLDHRVGDLPASLVGLEDVGLQVDALLRLPDRLRDGREDLVAVLQQFGLVVRDHGRAERVERAPEGGIGDRERTVELVHVPLLGPDQVAHHGAAGGAEDQEKNRKEGASHRTALYSRSGPDFV